MSRPPVEGVPAPRQRCEQCDKPLSYWTDDTRAPATATQRSRVVRRVFERYKGYPVHLPIFCTLRCALAFARAAHAAGYRIVRPS